MSGDPILVIGAGVSGSACAIRLRQLGVDVVLAEQADFPREKVCGCCIGGTGLAALDQLGLRDWALEAGQPTNRWHASLAGRQVELPLPTGVAISRATLDTKLLAIASAAGAQVQTPCTAKIESVQDTEVTAALSGPHDNKRVQKFAAVVVAAGLRGGGLQKLLPWTEQPNGPFGISFTAAPDDSVKTGVIYMACDEDGYVGLVRLENDRIDVAAALTSGSDAAERGSPVQRVEDILLRSAFTQLRLQDRSRQMTTPALRRSRQAGVGRVLAIGEAAGYVEPFTGEGMTWGMQSGLAAANLIASQDPLNRVGDAWNDELSILLKTQKRTCRAVTTALRYRLARTAAAQVLSRFPSIATPLIRSLNSPNL
ncbi:MAG: NAD(P)/FAD-dependent oxidoreductase [Rubripirellula sp.]